VDRARFELAPGEDGGGQPQAELTRCATYTTGPKESVSRALLSRGFEGAIARIDLPRSDAGL
jgi:hypothetical protein